jgi:conjugative transfer signal peptidase TraF
MRFVVLLMLIELAVLQLSGVRVNATESLARGVYWTRSTAAQPHEGELVCFDTDAAAAPRAARDYLRHATMLKVVRATAGALVELDAATGGIRIDGKLLPCSARYERDSLGVPLPRVVLPLVVPVGSVWLMSQSQRGFDSRYYGPVPLKALVCREARPVWLWDRGNRC